MKQKVAECSIMVLNQGEEVSEYLKTGRRVTYMKWQETKKNRGRRSRI